jgi:hypothetical protein
LLPQDSGSSVVSSFKPGFDFEVFSAGFGETTFLGLASSELVIIAVLMRRLDGVKFCLTNVDFAKPVPKLFLKADAQE